MKKRRKQKQPAPAGPLPSTDASSDTGAKPQTPTLSEEAEPTAVRTGFPVLLIALVGLLIYWGDVYVMDHADVMGKTGRFPATVYEPFKTYAEVEGANPRSPEIELRQKGIRVYGLYCVACHQANGGGNPSTAIPPLAGSEWVLAKDPSRIIRVVLHGLTGPIEVLGAQYGNAAMLAWKDSLSDEDVAAVLTYIRQEWGNKAPAVKPEQVNEIRKATEDRASNWTAPELQAISLKD
jgi:mono/diheme cytochrome c family protein